MQAISKPSTSHQIRFGTDGWRALIAKEFTYDNLELVTKAISAYILKNFKDERPVFIGYDARFLADQFAKFSANIFNSFGIDVKFIADPIATPVIAFAAQAEPSYGALMFTASHNPPEYMGIKFIPEYGGPASVEITNAILEEIENFVSDEAYAEKIMAKAHKAIGLNSAFDAKKPYVSYIKTVIDFDFLRKVNSNQKVKVVYDSLHGVGKNFVNLLLEDAGFEVIALHNTVDPTFGGSLPDPTVKRLVELKETVIKSSANLGAANDGDADRFAFIDDKGEFYPANKVLPVVAKFLYEEKGFRGSIARTLATTHLFDELAKKFGIECIETTVGFKWLCDLMRKQDMLIVAEESGGMSIHGHIPEKDGILAILLTAEILARTNKTLSQLWQEVQEFVGKQYFYDRLDLHIDGVQKDNFIAVFKNPSFTEIADFKVIKVDLKEGVKVYLDNGSWFLARPSGTEAMCRVYFEGNDKAALDKLVKAVEALV
jgi:phosphomannomutase